MTAMQADLLQAAAASMKAHSATRAESAQTEEQTRGLTERFVVPFYLKMMGTAAHANGLALVPAIRRLAAELTEQDVIALLRGKSWRERLMGAWYAIARPSEMVAVAVLQALVGSDLDRVPLVTAAATLAGNYPRPDIEKYCRTIGEGDPQSLSRAVDRHITGQDIVISHLRRTDSNWYAAMNEVAAALRGYDPS